MEGGPEVSFDGLDEIGLTLVLFPLLALSYACGRFVGLAVWFRLFPTQDREYGEYLNRVKRAQTEAREEADNHECSFCGKKFLGHDGHECLKPPGLQAITIMPVGAIVARSVKEPLYDRVFVPPTEAPQPIEQVIPRGYSDTYTANMNLYANCHGELCVNLPSFTEPPWINNSQAYYYAACGATLWVNNGDPACLMDKPVNIYFTATNQTKEYIGTMIWRSPGIMTGGFMPAVSFEPPIVIPHASQIRFRVINGSGGALSCTAAVHGVWFTKPSQEPSAFLPTHGPTTVSFFQNTYEDAHTRTPKTLADTNLRGQGGCLPQGHGFAWYGIKVEPDEGSDPDDLKEIKNKGVFEFKFSDGKYWTFTGSELIRDWDKIRAGGGRDSVDVTVSGEPVKISELECFKICLNTYGMKLKKGIWLKAVLEGVQARYLSQQDSSPCPT